jgi:phosphinothricin acetyltransferase
VQGASQRSNAPGLQHSNLMNIRNVVAGDFGRITEIYNYYVEHTVVTFDETPVTVQFMKQKAESILKSYPYLALEDERGLLVGYGYGSQFRAKPAYRFTVETTIYFDKSATGKGYGTVLYTRLLSELRDRGYKIALGVLGLPNSASARLHEKLGFVKTGHLKNVGWKFDQWVDTGYWHLDLETFHPSTK